MLSISTDTYGEDATLQMISSVITFTARKPKKKLSPVADEQSKTDDRKRNKN